MTTKTPNTSQVETESLVSSGYLDIVQFFQVIISNLPIILIVSVAGLIITFLVVNAQTPIYETQTTLIVLPNEQEAIPDPIESIDVALGTYVQVLRSQIIENNTHLALQDTYSRSELRDVDIEIQPIENSSVIFVSVQSSNPQLARDYANELARQIVVENPVPPFETAYRVGILDPANLPDTPSFPNLQISLLFGGIGSVILGILVAFLSETYVQSRSSAKLDDDSTEEKEAESVSITFPEVKL